MPYFVSDALRRIFFFFFLLLLLMFMMSLGLGAGLYYVFFCRQVESYLVAVAVVNLFH